MNKLTADVLEKHNACPKLLEQFRNDHPEGLNVPQSPQEQIDILLSSEVARQGWGWAVSKGIVPAWSMHDADLSGANLSGADLRGANLRGANLRGADLEDARNVDDAFVVD